MCNFVTYGGRIAIADHELPCQKIRLVLDTKRGVPSLSTACDPHDRVLVAKYSAKTHTHGMLGRPEAVWCSAVRSDAARGWIDESDAGLVGFSRLGTIRSEGLWGGGNIALILRSVGGQTERP